MCAAYLANRPTTASAASPDANAPLPAVAFSVPDQHPLDADYMVPGVLDNRSWKPEYDRMPTVRAVAPVRRLAVATHRPAAAPAPLPDAPAMTLPTEAPASDAAPVSSDVPQA